MYSYDPNIGNITGNYIFSKTGKTYIKALNTNYYFVGANQSAFQLYVTYGNTKNAVKLIMSGIAIISSLIILF